MIERFGREKTEDTAPETAFDSCMAEAGIKSEKVNPFSVTGKDNRTWTFRPDRKLAPRVYVEILGEYHMTRLQENKTRWRTESFAKAGLRVLLIDAPLLTDERFWPHVQKEVRAFIASTEPTKRLYA